MSGFNAGLKKLIAIIGLIAVLLGALEHEDLIFQSRNHDGKAVASQIDEIAPADQTLWKTTCDSGTEGTFRSESYRLWLSPKNEPTYTLRILKIAHSPVKETSGRGWRRDLRPRLAASVALRL